MRGSAAESEGAKGSSEGIKATAAVERRAESGERLPLLVRRNFLSVLVEEMNDFISCTHGPELRSLVATLARTLHTYVHTYRDTHSKGKASFTHAHSIGIRPLICGMGKG